MTQRELHRAVARVTGESVRTIHRLGFSIVPADNRLGDADPGEASPQVVDWDRVEADRIALAIQA